MDLNHVATFVKVVETGSFTRAAATLGLPKSSVSRSVTRLEDELGVRLLNRTTRQVQLTDGGRVYFEHVRAALGGVEEATRAVTDASAEPHGMVRVTAPPDLGGPFLADVMARFARQYPRIHVDLNLAARRVDLVAEGFDLAIRAGRLEDSTLVGRKIGDSEMGLFAAPAYLEKRGRPGAIEDLAGHDFILHRAQGAVPTWRLTGPDGEHVVPTQGRLTADDLGFVRHAVAAGLGIGLLPTWRLGLIASAGGPGKKKQSADCSDADDLLERVLPAYAHQGSTLHVLWPSARYVPVRVALLRDFLVAELTRARMQCETHVA